MCTASENSREHAPPQCLFPEKSDIGRDLRRNIITVPLCDEHNSTKSADDEFLRAVILMVAVGSNEIANINFSENFSEEQNVISMPIQNYSRTAYVRNATQPCSTERLVQVNESPVKSHKSIPQNRSTGSIVARSQGLIQHILAG